MSWFAVLLFFSSIIQGPVRVSATPQETDVRTLFLEVPSEMLRFHRPDGTIEPLTLRTKRIVLSDVRNGYLEVDTKGLEAFESKVQVALYKIKPRRRVLAVAYQIGDSTDDLSFFEKQTAGWREVTSELLPPISAEFVNRRARERVRDLAARNINLDDCASGTFRYDLPRKGTTISAKISSDCAPTGNGSLLFELHWNGARFTLDP